MICVFVAYKIGNKKNYKKSYQISKKRCIFICIEMRRNDEPKSNTKE